MAFMIISSLLTVSWITAEIYGKIKGYESKSTASELCFSFVRMQTAHAQHEGRNVATNECHKTDLFGYIQIA